MLYIIDDDQFNAISNTYHCDFVFDSALVRYYKNEAQIDFSIMELNDKDFVCYHNSFPCDRTLITNRLVEANEDKTGFTLICFSAAAEFNNLRVENKYIKVHKDRFYGNLRLFIDSGFNINTLLYGETGNEVELSLIQKRINSALFSYPKTSDLPIRELLPSDLKRICEIKGLNYPEVLKKIANMNVEQFRKYISLLIQNK